MSFSSDAFQQKWEAVQNHTDFSLAFLHGTLTADCCHQKQRVLSLFDTPNETVLKFLAVWQINIEKSLQSDDYAYPLPTSDNPAELSQTLKDWASGFVYGIDKLANVLDPLNIEFCDDIQHIANMSVIEAENVNEETARDLAEIEEYCRMGAISVFTEMRGEEDKGSTEVH